MKLSKNFSKWEFDSKDGAEMPDDVLCNIITLVSQLQYLRDYTEKSISINSGYRSPEHNKNEGGRSNSQHLYGKAADIVIKGLSPNMVYELIEDLIEKGEILQGGLGLYKTFIHYDIRKTKARWTN